MSTIAPGLASLGATPFIELSSEDEPLEGNDSFYHRHSGAWTDTEDEQGQTEYGDDPMDVEWEEGAEQLEQSADHPSASRTSRSVTPVRSLPGVDPFSDQIHKATRRDTLGRGASRSEPHQRSRNPWVSARDGRGRSTADGRVDRKGKGVAMAGTNGFNCGGGEARAVKIKQEPVDYDLTPNGSPSLRGRIRIPNQQRVKQEQDFRPEFMRSAPALLFQTTATPTHGRRGSSSSANLGSLNVRKTRKSDASLSTPKSSSFRAVTAPANLATTRTTLSSTSNSDEPSSASANNGQYPTIQSLDDRSHRPERLGGPADRPGPTVIQPADTADVTFVVFQPRKKKNKNGVTPKVIDDSILNLTKKPVSLQIRGQKEGGLGSVYVFTCPAYPGFVKIGYTSDMFDARRKAQESGWKMELVTSPEHDKAEYQIRHYDRVEKLVFLELVNERRDAVACTADGQVKKACGGEWFEIEEKKALEVVERWRKWMKTAMPYDERTGKLTMWWMSKVRRRSQEPVRGSLNEWLRPQTSLEMVVWLCEDWGTASRAFFFDSRRERSSRADVLKNFVSIPHLFFVWLIGYFYGPPCCFLVLLAFLM